MRSILIITSLLIASIASRAAGSPCEPQQFQWGQVKGAPSVAVGPSGDVFVADLYGGRIRRFLPDGSLFGVWDEYGVSGISISASGEVFLAKLGHVDVVTPEGEHLRGWDFQGSGNEFGAAADLAVTHDGFVYVSDADHETVLKFDANGNSLGQLDPLHTPVPKGVAVDGNGNVYVASSREGIQVFDAEGRFVRSWPVVTAGEIGFAEGVCWSTSGQVVVVVNRIEGETYSTLVRRFDPNGALGCSTVVAQLSFDAALGIAEGASGLFVADVNQGHLIFLDYILPNRRATWGQIKTMYK